MSNSDEWCTPPELFKELDEVFNFFWDACCTKNNCLVKGQGIEVGYDYLQEDSSKYDYPGEGSIFINPPYSNPLPFIKKAWEDAKYFRVVCLVKHDHTTKWFNYALDQADKIVIGRQGNYSVKEAVQTISDELDWYPNIGDVDKVGVLMLQDLVNNVPSTLLIFDRCEVQ